MAGGEGRRGEEIVDGERRGRRGRRRGGGGDREGAGRGVREIAGKDIMRWRLHNLHTFRAGESDRNAIVTFWVTFGLCALRREKSLKKISEKS